MQSIDDDRYKKYFARRRVKSNWSEKNKELAQMLIEQDLMTQQGLDKTNIEARVGIRITKLVCTKEDSFTNSIKSRR